MRFNYLKRQAGSGSWGIRLPPRIEGDRVVRRLNGERGASAVEFAIVASLLFLILFGTISFGIVFNRYQAIQATAREGARLGALANTERDEIVGRVRAAVSVLNGPNFQTDCAANPPSLSVDQGCIDVFRRESSGASRVEVNGGTSAPCGVQSPGEIGQKAVIVEVFYRTRIDIPLWASPQLTLSSLGEFKCEGS